MKFYNSGIKPGFVITIKCKVTLVSPVSKLINNGTIQIVINLSKRTLFCMYISCTESTGGVASVESYDDSTKLSHMGLGHLSERGMTELHKRGMDK